MNLEEFGRGLREQVVAAVGASGGSISADSVFATEGLAVLTENGETLDPQLCSYRGRGTRVDAYDYLEDSDEIDLFVVDFDDSDVIRRISSADVHDALMRCRTFLRRSLEGLHTRLPESTDAHSLAQTVHAARATLRSARVFLLTNRIAPSERIDDVELLGIPVTQVVWDIERLLQVFGDRVGRPILSVNFRDDFGGGLPCLMAQSNEVYDSYLLAIPGRVLAEVYARWGQRLLERNVRSFLQARGAVNQGIRRTLDDQPNMFFAYNNGISATANSVTLDRDSNQSPILTAVEDLQIVNGGQTTASTYEAFRRGADLTDVYVPTKLSVIRDKTSVDSIVPAISRFANSQTKVSFSDFSANDPYHLQLEKLSREIWAPNPDQRGKSITRWFYERARGQYLDDRFRQLTAAKRRAWEIQHPAGQKLTKTLVAKYEMSWQQQPHRVSEGSEKNFAHYSIWLQAHRPVVDEQYFERLIAKAILFQTCDRIVGKLGLGGYKANVVTYSVAWLSSLTGQQLDLASIWRSQAVPANVAEMLEMLAASVWEHLTTPPTSVRNVSEWSKKLACWETLSQRSVDLPATMKDLVVGATITGLTHPNGVGSAIEGIPGSAWIALARWGDETGNLKYWERGLAQSLADYVVKRRQPTPKQAKHGVRIYRAAVSAGFTPPV